MSVRTSLVNTTIVTYLAKVVSSPTCLSSLKLYTYSIYIVLSGQKKTQVKIFMVYYLSKQKNMSLNNSTLTPCHYFIGHILKCLSIIQDSTTKDVQIFKTKFFRSHVYKDFSYGRPRSNGSKVGTTWHTLELVTCWCPYKD